MMNDDILRVALTRLIAAVEFCAPNHDVLTGGDAIACEKELAAAKEAAAEAIRVTAFALAPQKVNEAENRQLDARHCTMKIERHTEQYSGSDCLYIECPPQTLRIDIPLGHPVRDVDVYSSIGDGWVQIQGVSS